MSHVSTFREYLQTQFGIQIPKDVVLNEQEGVIRAYSKSVMMMRYTGYMGFVGGKISTRGIEVKSEFVQLFGKNASKNILELDEKQARDFVHVEFISIGTDGEGYKIAKFGRHVLGVGKLKDGKLYSEFIGKGRKRAENEIRE